VKRTLVLCLLLAAVTLVTYWPVSRAEFTNYDDNEYVSDNPHIVRGLTWDDVRWAFRSGYAGNWHPLTWVSHMIDVQWFGLQQPGWHHLVNLLFHTVNAVLLLLLLQRLTSALWPSVFVAALFALHPQHVESVAWIAERKDVLSTFFFFLTLLAYERYAGARSKAEGRNPNTWRWATSRIPKAEKAASPSGGFKHATSSASLVTWYLLALFFFALGLMSKPMLVTAPFVLLLLDYWPLSRWRAESGERGAGANVSGGATSDVRCGQESPRSVGAFDLLNPFNPFNRSNRPLLLEKVPFFVLSAVASVVTFLVQRHEGAVNRALPFAGRAGNAVVSYFRYIRKMFWPTDLCVCYPHPKYWPAATVVFCAVVLAGVSFLALWYWRRRPWLLTGWLWYLGMLVPVIGLVQVGGQAMADRYAYLPTIGLSLMLVWSLAELSRRGSYGRVLVPGAGLAALAGCVLLTSRQVSFWKDSETLFRRALAIAPNAASSHGALGRALADKGRLDDAAPYFREAIKLDPRDTVAYVGLAEYEVRHDHPDEAIRLLKQVLQVDPNDPYAHNNLGMVLGRQGDLPGATTQFYLAVQANPDNAEAHANLGMALLTPDIPAQTDEAIVHLQQAIRLKPAYAKAHVNLGVAYARKGLLDQAVAEFQAALKAKPDYTEAADYLKQALAEKAAKQRN
jgi:protein O-mannosyl-transferase